MTILILYPPQPDIIPDPYTRGGSWEPLPSVRIMWRTQKQTVFEMQIPFRARVSHDTELIAISNDTELIAISKVSHSRRLKAVGKIAINKTIKAIGIGAPIKKLVEDCRIFKPNIKQWNKDASKLTESGAIPSEMFIAPDTWLPLQQVTFTNTEKGCPICQTWHGDSFDFDDEDKPTLPIHAGCKCCYKYPTGEKIDF